MARSHAGDGLDRGRLANSLAGFWEVPSPPCVAGSGLALNEMGACMPVYSRVAAMQHWLVVCMHSMRMQGEVVSSGGRWTVECGVTVLAAGCDGAACCGCPLVLVVLTDWSSGQALLTRFVQ
jgi:hypothetical protein